MKNKKNLGHLLSEQEMKDAKGGYVQTGSDPDNWKYCPLCGNPYEYEEPIILFYFGIS